MKPPIYNPLKMGNHSDMLEYIKKLKRYIKTKQNDKRGKLQNS